MSDITKIFPPNIGRYIVTYRDDGRYLGRKLPSCGPYHASTSPLKNLKLEYDIDKTLNYQHIKTPKPNPNKNTQVG